MENPAFHRLANRLADDPSFVSYRLAAVRRQRGQTFELQAAALDCNLEVLTLLSLCRMPRDAGEVEQIARRFGIDPGRPARVLGMS